MMENDLLLLKNDYSLLEKLIKFRELGKLNKNELTISKLPNEFWEKVESEIKKYFIFLHGINKTYPRLKYKEVEEAFIKNNEFITTTHIRERRGNILTSKYQSPIFVYEFPYEKRHFYDKKCPVDNKYTHSFDLIGHNGYGEIASGGEREYKAEIVEKQIKEKRFRLENNHTLHWYHASKKYGSVPHAGFSIGLERLTSWITQTDHISNTIGFPRRIIGTDLQY